MLLEEEAEIFLEEEIRNYLHSDYLSSFEQEIEAEVPVPDRLQPKAKSLLQLKQTKLSQRIGLLLWMNRMQILSIGGKQRLIYLQEKASLEAIQAGIRFAARLESEKKLQSDFKHVARELNRRPQSRRFRRRENRRMGVGYRDKGTLPDSDSRALRLSTEESFIPIFDLPVEIICFLQKVMPSCLEGDWIDLSSLQNLDSVEKLTLTQLVPSL